jgi:hypothetical protein
MDQYPIKPEVLAEIEAERGRQNVEWGGPEHDEGHCCEDWLTYIAKQMRCIRGGTESAPRPARERMVMIAALAVAALENAPDLQPTTQGDNDA